MKAAKREETRIAQAAEKDIQLSKKGNKRRVEAPIPPIDEIQGVDVVDVDASPIIDEVPSSSAATRTRSIRLPQRYRT